MKALTQLRLEAWGLRLGLAPIVRLARRAATAVAPARRALRKDHELRFREFRDRYAEIVRPPAGAAWAGDKLAVLNVGGFPPAIELVIAIMKALQLAGYRVAALLRGGTSGFVEPYYRLAGAVSFYDWKNFRVPADVGRARALVEACTTLNDLLCIEEGGVRVGRFAVSSALRRTRRGSVGLGTPEDRDLLTEQVAASRQAHGTAERFLGAVQPDLVVFVDTEYTPTAELFDACLERGIGVVQYDLAHKSDAIMLQRYTRDNRDQHPWSLSRLSWDRMLSLEWTAERRRRVADELERAYRSRDWFSACATQFSAKPVSADELRLQLGLDPTRKTAVIFSHIVWDAPVIWGTRLFATYEEWLVETVRVACENQRLNWLVKVHPANVGKALKEGFFEEPAESRVLREQLGALPQHVRILPADTDVSTLSLFGVTDYCITVRGTVGMEAARLGIPVLAAGGGRYDRRGFTLDPASREEYLSLLSRLETVPRLTPAQQELADRFVYGYLLLRPLVLSSVGFRYREARRENGTRTLDVERAIRVHSAADWATAPDIQALVAWLSAPESPDYFAWPDHGT